jgi:cytochrome c553
MSELYKAVVGCVAIATFFIFMIMPNMAYSGYSSSSSCTGECYEEYVALNGTAPEIEQRKKALANLDEFSDIRSLWAGCAACHGAEGQGMAVFPKLAGQSSDYIVSRLNAYKNRETVGNMSSTMWSQAGMLSDEQMDQIGKFIEAGLPGK